MASRIKPAEAAKTISDALALSHCITANFLVALGEFTPLFTFVDSKHPGMDFVKQDISMPGTLLVGSWGTDDNTINLWLSMEAVILVASLVYWGICYLCTRLILLLTV